ncbi:hypothetical protein UlMin_027665 [Ulmus minor]
MDFHSLTRKELQALSKRNKIPANITNVAMADALVALQHVEGLEEILNKSTSDSQQFPEETMIGSPEAPRTSCRTTTRQKPIKEEQGNSDVHNSPAPLTSRRRAVPVSARQRTESRKVESLVQRVYSTRRSVRLLEKTMEKLTMDEDGNTESIKMDDLDDDSTNFGDNSQTISEVCSRETDHFEVSSKLKDDVQEKIDASGNEVEVPESKSKSLDEPREEMSGESHSIVVEKPDETMEGKDESPNEKELDVVPQNLEIVKISSGVSAEVIDEVAANESSAAVQEENELSGVKYSMEPILFTRSSPCVQTKNIVEECQNQTAEDFEKIMEVCPDDDGNHSSKSHSAIEVESAKLKALIDEVGDFDGKFDFESDSMTEDESEDETSEEESGHYEVETKVSLVDVPKISSPPFAADQLAGQFPRPSPSVLGKSSNPSKANLLIQKLTDDLDETDEENIENGENNAVLKEGAEVKENKKAAEASLRQLRKMLRQKLQIVNNKNSEDQTDHTKVRKERIALQTLPENQMDVDNQTVN